VSSSIPPLRVVVKNEHGRRAKGEYVLYWMIAQRRSRASFALDHALGAARELKRPLVVLEPLRVAYPHASARLHRFVLDGMRDNRAAFEAAGVAYHPYVEPSAGAGRGLLLALAARACLVVTDEWPAFFLPRMVAAAAKKLDVRLEAVDGSGLLPLRASPSAPLVAHAFRRTLQKTLPEHLLHFPAKAPLAAGDGAGGEIPAAVLERWPAASSALLNGEAAALAALPIDPEVPPVPFSGGSEAGRAVLERFLAERLERYGERSHPDAESASGLSPYLHFGHVGAHEVVGAVLEREGWDPGRAAPKPTGKREGWWGLSAPAETFLDELVTWRELGYHFAHHRPDDYDAYASLPDWAKKTLAEHARDPRTHLYSEEQLERAETHDELWNAAQRQLREEGTIQNYLRMLWGKKVLEWTRSPEEAARILVRLNDRWAVDGRDPNSYSGIYWVLGRHDRPWPERQIFGTVRYMTSGSTRNKLKLKSWLRRFSAPPQQELL
jgi:deoxyribodipyrimidine photo-lyase